MEPENVFIIKSYGKGELACLYLPGINPQSAAKALKKWIEKYPGLSESLAAAGSTPTDKRYTPVQVGLIVNALGYP